MDPLPPPGTMQTPSFSERLEAAIRRCRNPIMAGLDPRVESLPAILQPENIRDPGQVAQAYRQFCCDVIDVVANRVPVVKPQAAFFEQWGPAGMQALAATIDYARSRGLLVVVDGKRNDIGATAEAYAAAWLGSKPASAWGGDALTVNPYMGDDSIEPFLQQARAHSAGVFVLVKTSNPGGKRFQDLHCEGRPLYRHVAEYVEGLSQSCRSANGYGDLGAVVGATYPAQIAELRTIMPATWFLVPGFGTQGGSARDCAPAFDEQGLGAVINNSRGLIFAHARAEYRERFSAGQWQDAVAAALDDMLAQLKSETNVARL